MKKILTQQNEEVLISFLSTNPLAGDVIVGTGGIRKLRWSIRENQGKRGGTRIIYYYYRPESPLFLVYGYTKNQQENISDADKNNFKN